jgi:hypothetical protein
MAFQVVIDLQPPDESNFIIKAVHVIGDLDKPKASTLPGGDQKLGEKLHACHVIAWKILAQGIAQQITGVPLRTAAKAAFRFNDFQANGVSATQIKEFMEGSIMETLKELQKNVHNYYAGPGRANMSGGGKMGKAIGQLNELHEQYQRSQWGPNRITEQKYQSHAVNKQIGLFKAGYDESRFYSDAEKALARGEYVAFWYQIYYGGEPDSTRYARFLIETSEGQQAIDDLIQHGR